MCANIEISMLTRYKNNEDPQKDPQEETFAEEASPVSPLEGQTEQSSDVHHVMRAIYVPVLPAGSHYNPPQPTYEQRHQVGLPYDCEVFPGDPLLVVVSCPAHLQAARLASENGSDIVIWAWLCSEVLARQAESEFPVVYGIPTAEQVTEAAIEGIRDNDTTSLCLALESAFKIPEQL